MKECCIKDLQFTLLSWQQAEIFNIYLKMKKIIKREHLFGAAPCLSALKAMRRKIYKAYVNEKYRETQPVR